MKSKILFVTSLLFGVMMVNSGLNKFFNYMPAPPMEGRMAELMKAFNSIGWLIPLVGFVEIMAGVLVVFPKTRALGAIMVFPVMVGIMHLHIYDAPANLPFATVFFLVNLWMIVDNFKKYKAMIS